MKVVLFCGGLGLRLREFEGLPKPMVPIGCRPILWHVMKYYAHFGHKDFILCLGHGAEVVKNYFLNYNECSSNDFTMTKGGKSVTLMRSDIHDWRITFVDTGLKSNVGQRLRLIRSYVEQEEIFLANYSDGLTDMPLNQMIEEFSTSKKVAAFVCAPPSQSFHVVDLGENRLVKKIEYVRDAGVLVNAGFFVLRQSIFDYMQEGEELVLSPFQRLIKKDLLMGYRYDRFWSMDTFKEQQELSDMVTQGNAPWEVWRISGSDGGKRLKRSSGRT